MSSLLAIVIHYYSRLLKLSLLTSITMLTSIRSDICSY